MKKTSLQKKEGQQRDKIKENTNDLVFSYLTLRNLIGFTGILLPLTLPLFSHRAENEKIIQGSISAYYYTSMGDVFVIVICILSAFLLTYKGYKVLEKILLVVAAISGFGLSLFPTEWHEGMPAKSAHVQHVNVPKVFFGIELHWMFAALFFFSLSLVSIFYFTKSSQQTSWFEKKDGQLLSQKSWRNIIYVSMGSIMLLSMVIILIYSVVDPIKKLIGDFSLIFFMETVAVLAFGIAWITKGETLFPDKDRPHYFKKVFRVVSRKDEQNREALSV